MQALRARVIGLAIALTGLIAAVPAAVQPVNDPSYAAPPYLPSIWQGLYGGLHAGYGKADPATGFAAGLQIGYNWQASQIVYGLEGDGSFAEISTKDTTVFGWTVKASVDWLATARGRLGFLVTPNMLAYGTLGIGYARASASSIVPGFSLTVTESDTALVYGAGIEGKLTDSMSLRAEYLSFGDLDIHVLRGALNFKFGN